MIKINQISKEVQQHSCDNCNREMPFILKYSFCNSQGKEYIQLHLCEDCANAVANLFYTSMEEGKSFKYDKDEITELKEEK